MPPKYKIFDCVHVDKTLPYFMSHFDNDFNAIIREWAVFPSGYYYMLCKLNNGEVVDELAWYPETKLTNISLYNKDEAQRLVEIYELL